MAKAKARKFGGRPRQRKPKPGERLHLGLRVSPELKRKLENAAKESTRSLSQEAEFRLEYSFRAEELIEQHLQRIDEIFARDAQDKARIEKRDAALGRMIMELSFVTGEDKKATRIAEFRREAELPDLPVETIKDLMAGGASPEHFAWLDADSANDLLLTIRGEK